MIIKRYFTVFSCIINVISIEFSGKTNAISNLRIMTERDRLKVKCHDELPSWKPMTLDREGLVEGLSITTSYQTGKAPCLLTPVSVIFKNTKITRLKRRVDIIGQHLCLLGRFSNQDSSI